jgi:tellurite methyltransferase
MSQNQPFKTTVYDQRYKSTENYWQFRPSSMSFKILELQPPTQKPLRALEIGCGEGGNAIFLARNGYVVTAFDLSEVGVQKTKENAEKNNIEINVFKADINEYLPTDEYDLIFSSGTVQYLLPEKRQIFIEACKTKTSINGLNVFHTFVKKPFVPKAPDAEENEHLWKSGELLTFYFDWKTEHFVEEIKACNSSGVPHQHAHNRIWSRKVF